MDARGELSRLSHGSGFRRLLPERLRSHISARSLLQKDHAGRWDCSRSHWWGLDTFILSTFSRLIFWNIVWTFQVTGSCSVPDMGCFNKWWGYQGSFIGKKQIAGWKGLVARAVQAWRTKYPACKVDDCAVVLPVLKGCWNFRPVQAEGSAWARSSTSTEPRVREEREAFEWGAECSWRSDSGELSDEASSAFQHFAPEKSSQRPRAVRRSWLHRLWCSLHFRPLVISFLLPYEIQETMGMIRSMGI